MDKRLIDWSNQVKMAAGWVCSCGELDKTLLEAHHIKPIYIFPERLYDLDNGECICMWGHALSHQNDRRIMEHILARLAVKIFPRFFPESVKKHGIIEV